MAKVPTKTQMKHVVVKKERNDDNRPFSISV